MATLDLDKVVKEYGSNRVIHAVDLNIDHGEFVVFVGPSGCGKSTLLRMIAGLEEITDGEMRLDGRVINDVPAAQRGLAMVFQSYALYPHMSVRKNLSFGLENLKIDKAEIDRRVAEAARMLEIGQYLDRKPKALSGGQRQRVAIGRAIVREPKIFLFDEPLSNLDAELRVRMRTEITGLHERLGNTMIYVTHDQVEAMTMADKIVVLRAGRVEQVGRPLDLYNAPANMFVAGFIGSPRMNFIPVTLVSGGGGHAVVRLSPERAVACDADADGLAAGTALTLGIRPEHLDLAPPGEGDALVTVAAVEQLGMQSFLYCALADGTEVTVQVVGQTDIRRGDRLGLTLRPGKAHLFDTGSGAALPRR